MVPIASPFHVLCTFPEIPKVARGDLIHREDSKGLNSTLSSRASGLQALVRLCSNKSYSRMDGAKSLLQLCWEIMIPSESTSFCDVPPDLPDISQHKNTLAELTQTCRFLSSSHLVSASDGCALQAEPGFAGSSSSPRPPSAPDNFILIAQILSLDFISCPAAPVIARAFLTRYQQPTSPKGPYQLSVAQAQRGNSPVPPCTNSWAVVNGINCWYALGCVFLLLSFPLQLWKARF